MKQKFKLLLIIGLLLGSIQISWASMTIKFATEATYPPFASMDSHGKMQGFGVDVAKAVCQAIKAQCTFGNQAFDSLIPDLKLGKFDVLFGGIGVTAARQQQINFSSIYYQTAANMVSDSSTSHKILSQGLNGLTIGVQQGTTFDSYLQQQYGSNITIKRYPSIQGAFLDLTTGRIDAAFGDDASIAQWLKKTSNTDYAIVPHLIKDQSALGQGYAFGVAKQNTTLLTALNKGLSVIKKNGSLAKIKIKYFGQTS